LKAAQEKLQVTYKCKPIRITVDFSVEILMDRRAWKNVFEHLKENNCQPRLLFPAKLSFRIKE
jgi:hypothetical protein